MAVFRCPQCGQKIKKEEKYCKNCGNKIDNAIIDQVATNNQEAGMIIFKCLAIIVLWFIILFFLGFISNILNIPVKYAFYSSFILTILAYILLKR